METGPVFDRNIAVRRGGGLGNLCATNGYIAGGREFTFRIDGLKFGSYAHRIRNHLSKHL